MLEIVNHLAMTLQGWQGVATYVTFVALVAVVIILATAD